MAAIDSVFWWWALFFFILLSHHLVFKQIHFRSITARKITGFAVRISEKQQVVCSASPPYAVGPQGLHRTRSMGLPLLKIRQFFQLALRMRKSFTSWLYALCKLYITIHTDTALILMYLQTVLSHNCSSGLAYLFLH
jgi:hypothetical protein